MRLVPKPKLLLLDPYSLPALSQMHITDLLPPAAAADFALVK